MKFPPHKASMFLFHNAHKNGYHTVEEVSEREEHDWVSEEEKQKAIATDELWTIQWYPHTPVGFYMLSASTLEALLEAANAEDGGQSKKME